MSQLATLAATINRLTPDERAQLDLLVTQAERAHADMDHQIRAELAALRESLRRHESNHRALCAAYDAVRTALESFAALDPTVKRRITVEQIQAAKTALAEATRLLQ